MKLDEKNQDKLALIILGAMLLFAFLQNNNRKQQLVSNHVSLTVAYVYGYHETTGSRYYNYIYKVGDDYFSGSNGKLGVKNPSRWPMQCYPVAYNYRKPSTHTILTSHRFKERKQLGIDIKLPNAKSLIEEHSSGAFESNSSIASKNQKEDIQAYLQASKAYEQMLEERGAKWGDFWDF